MHEDIAAGFLSLSTKGKIAVLARTIHMETIHVREAYLEHPDDALRIYMSSEFIHRLSGAVMGLARNHDRSERETTYIVTLLIEGVAPRGQYHLNKLSAWIIEASSISD